MPRLRDLRCLRVRAFELSRAPDGAAVWELAQAWIFYGRTREDARKRLARQREADPNLRTAVAGNPKLRTRSEWVC